MPQPAWRRQGDFEEHLVLDRMLEQLVAQTGQPTPVAADIQQNWQTFATKLQAHDEAEAGLLQMAFGSANIQT